MTVKILKCELQIVDPLNAKEVLSKLSYLKFRRVGSYLASEVEEIKWSGVIELEMLMLSSVVKGHITFRGEEVDFRLRIAGKGKLEWQRVVYRYETTHVITASRDVQQGCIDGIRYSLCAENGMLVLKDKTSGRKYRVSIPDIGMLLLLIQKDQSDRVLQALESYIEPLE